MTEASDQKKRRKRPDLNAERIAAEALALVDADGIDALSFRALARRLHCEAMSLYHYYPSKQHLIDALVSLCLAEVEVPEPGPDRRAGLTAFAQSYRAMVVRHAGFARIIVTHRLNHRDGLAKLERAAALFTAPGVSTALQAHLFRVMSYYVTGAAIDEALGYAAGPSAAEPVPRDEALRDFPMIMSMGAYFGPDHHDEMFATGLDLLLDWVEREFAAAAS